MRLLAALLLLTAVPALAQDTTTTAGPAGHWSVATGETVSPGRDALDFRLGWPGVTATYLHGLSDRSDVGLRVEMLYGIENTSYSKFGFGFGVPLRLVVNRSGKVLLGLHIDPAFRVYTGSGSTDFFMRFPVGALLGIQATPELRLAAAVDLTMAVQLANTAFFEVGPQFGFAAEYAVDRTLNVGLNVRFGPQFYSYGGGSDFAFTTELVVGYRL